MHFQTLVGLVLQAAVMVHSSPLQATSQTRNIETRSNIEARDSCVNGAGECVTYFADQAGTIPLGSYKPTCEGNCFQYSSFSSLTTTGSILPPFGVSCEVFSDSNCQNEIANIGNHYDVQSTSFSTANSMICYYNC